MKKVVLLSLGLLVLAFSFFGSLHTESVAPPAPSQVADVATSIAEATTASPPPSNTYPVVKVIDGDTLAVLMNGKPVTLRLIGLDTPETVDPRKPVQCFGKAASDKAKELLSGKVVRLEFDASQGMLDKYGRTLAYVILPDGTLFNKYMIAAGYAHEYTYNLPYKYQKEFKAAEKTAREEKRGLWADDTCAGNTRKSAAS